MTTERIAKYISVLFASKGKVCLAGIIVVWTDLLKNYSDEELEMAFSKAIESPDDFPTVGKLIALIGGDDDQIEIEAGEQFWLVLKSSTEWNDIKCNEIAKAAAKQIGGINAVIHSRDRDLQFIRRDFVSAYKRVKKSKIGRKTLSLPEALRLEVGETK